MLKKIKNRIVVLGSSSFVARNIINYLKIFKVRLFLVSRKQCDLQSLSAVKYLKKNIKSNDIVIFVAAKVPVKNSEMLISNLEICKNICESLLKKKIKHLLYVSSDAVYKDSKYRINEDSIVQPNSLHGIMHLTREIMINNYFSGPLTIVRPTLIFGKNDPHNGYGPNKFLRLAKKNKNITLFGRGEELRDHVWVKDVAKLIVQLILKKKYGIYNICSGKVVSFFSIAKKIIYLLNSKSKIIYVKRKGSIPHGGFRAFNNFKIKKNLKKIKFTNLNYALLQVINEK